MCQSKQVSVHYGLEDFGASSRILEVLVRAYFKPVRRSVRGHEAGMRVTLIHEGISVLYVGGSCGYVSSHGYQTFFVPFSQAAMKLARLK